MHAGIRSTAPRDPHRRVQDLLQRPFDFPLHGPPIGLQLPAAEPRPVVGQRRLERLHVAAHCRMGLRPVPNFGTRFRIRRDGSETRPTVEAAAPEIIMAAVERKSRASSLVEEATMSRRAWTVRFVFAAVLGSFATAASGADEPTLATYKTWVT